MSIPQKARDLSTSALLASAVMTSSTTDDVDYGTLTYGQFLDPSWRELRKYVYGYGVNIGGSQGAFFRTLFVDGHAFASAGLATVPVISPPRAPQINGKDAFEQQTGVGLQPVLTWSKPAIGIPTSYWVEIEEYATYDVLPPARIRIYSRATVRSGTSFKMPAGFLKYGSRYAATITAVFAGGDLGDRLQIDADYSSAPCTTAFFLP